MAAIGGTVTGSMHTQPRRFGDNLNEWFHTLGREWKPLLASSLVVYVPLALLVMGLFWVSGAAESFAILLDPEAIEEMSLGEFLDAVVPFLLSVGIWTIFLTVAGVFVYIAAARIVTADRAEEEHSWRTVSRFAATRSPAGIVTVLTITVGAVLVLAVPTAIGWALITGIGAGFLTVFLTTTAALTALVVLIWLTVSVAMALPVIAVENASPFAALARSYTLVRGRWWHTIGFIMVVAIIASAASQVTSLPLFPFFLAGMLFPEVLAFGFGVSVVLQGPLVAAIGAGYAIWYFDLRARDESLGPEPGPPAL